MSYLLMQLRRAASDRRGWKAAGIVASIAIAVGAFLVLAHALKNIDIHHVLQAMLLTDHWRLALAAALVVMSYGSLTLYDLLALRHIGRRDVPYRIAALASFTSYPIAHGLGAVLPISTAIRYRIYSSHGLGAVDVAKICFLTGLTFWMGNLTALGLSMLYQPDAIGQIDDLPVSLNRLLAIGLLVAVVGYLCWTWTRPRQIGHRTWSVTLPARWLAVLQIGLGIVDLGCAALALYVLIPAGLQIEIPRIIAVFIAAVLLGFLSHAPGGIGVFDATILLGLDTDDKEPLVAAILLFRALYHLLPFMLALMLFGIREAWQLWEARRTPQPVTSEAVTGSADEDAPKQKVGARL
jgi:glycosyltransferase 2 family protein